MVSYGAFGRFCRVCGLIPARKTKIQAAWPVSWATFTHFLDKSGGFLEYSFSRAGKMNVFLILGRFRRKYEGFSSFGDEKIHFAHEFM